MARVFLDDSCGCRVRTGAKVLLDNDCGCGSPVIDPTVPLPTIWRKVEIRLRTRTGFDDDGNPVFSWTPVAVEDALLWEDRTEFDPDAGVTLVKARITLSNTTGLVEVPETAVVAEPDSDLMWRITASKVWPDSILLDLGRIEQAETGE